jgi:hypothetical protein
MLTRMFFGFVINVGNLCQVVNGHLSKLDNLKLISVHGSPLYVLEYEVKNGAKSKSFLRVQLNQNT